MKIASHQDGLTWQIGVWNQISQLYVREIDRRFFPVVDGVIDRASLRPGERVLDVGTGTGAAAIRAAVAVGAAGSVVGIDISQEMLTQARQAAAGKGVGSLFFMASFLSGLRGSSPEKTEKRGRDSFRHGRAGSQARQTALDLRNVQFIEGGAEAIPAGPAAFDVVLASLSLMYVIDRAAAAREIARVLRPGGRLVSAVWADPASCDIVLFQQTAGSFAPPPPVPGVGPGALADPRVFVAQLAAAGIEAEVQSEVLGFDFDDFESAWTVLAGVTTAQLSRERLDEAKTAVRNLMWPHGDGRRHFRNTTHFIVGRLGPRPENEEAGIGN